MRPSCKMGWGGRHQSLQAWGLNYILRLSPQIVHTSNSTTLAAAQTFPNTFSSKNGVRCLSMNNYTHTHTHTILVTCVFLWHLDPLTTTTNLSQSHIWNHNPSSSEVVWNSSSSLLRLKLVTQVQPKVFWQTKLNEQPHHSNGYWSSNISGFI